MTLHPTRTLKDIAEINPRATHTADDQLVSFVGMADLDEVAARTSAGVPRRFSEVSKGYTPFQNGDLLAAKITPCWQNGKVGEAALELEHGMGSTEFHVIRPGPEADRRYLLHYLRTPRVRDTGTLRMTGSGGQRRVPTKYISDLTLPTPPLAEQRRIASILDEADAIRAKRHAQLARLDELPRTLFQEIPKNQFKSAPLSSIASFIRGVTYKPADVTDSGVGVMRTKNIRKQLDISDIVRITPARPIKPEKFLRNGDTLVSSANSWNLVGKCCLAEGLQEAYAIGGFVTALRPTPKVDPTYLYHWFSSQRVQETVRSFANQTTNISNLNIKRTEDLLVPIPPKAVQQSFADRVIAIRAERDRVAKALEADDELFAALQHRAFRGEL